MGTAVWYRPRMRTLGGPHSGTADHPSLRTIGLGLLFAWALVAVCLPRFNRRDVLWSHRVFGTGVSSTVDLADARHYVAYVQYFRHERGAEDLRAPFTYRPIGPLLAAWLPFDPMTALNVVNVVALLVALALLDRVLAGLGCAGPQRAGGAALFTFSFPVFYYGAIGYVDPVGIAFLMAGALLVVRQRWLPLAAVLVLGALAKETTIVLLPAAIARLLVSGRSRGQCLALASVLCGCYAAAALLVRYLAPGVHTYVWEPSLNTLAMNLSRPRAWLTLALSLGLPGILSLRALPGLLRRRTPTTDPALAALSAGYAAALAAFLCSLVAAYADGRFIWLSYPFAIPLAMSRGMLVRGPGGHASVSSQKGAAGTA